MTTNLPTSARPITALAAGLQLGVLVAGALMLSLAGGTAAQSDEPMGLASEPGPLKPGTYVDDSTGASVTFTVGDGWIMSGEPLEDVGTELSVDGTDLSVSLVAFGGSVFEQPCATVGDDVDAWLDDAMEIEHSAAAFIDHLLAHPGLAAAAPAPAAVDGASGLALDVTSTVDEACDPGTNFLWQMPIVREFHLNDGVTARVIALDVGDEVLVFVAETSSTDPAAMAPFDALVETITVTS